MNINISNANGEPIYLQIANQIKTLILEGKLREGDALPSMRILASVPTKSWNVTALSKAIREEARLSGHRTLKSIGRSRSSALKRC